MKSGKLIINGHYRQQRVTGAQRYAHEIVSQFDEHALPYQWVQPPSYLQANSMRQLWMQGVMPMKVPAGKLLWSPTNVGPVMCENQVLSLHDIADQLYPEWFSSKYVQWRQLILPRLLRRVRRIITVSEYSRQTILEKFPVTKGRVEVIHNGVRTDHFYPRRSKEVEKLRREHNLQKPFVLSVGSLDPRKNIGGLINAWYRLPGRIRDEMNLVITGKSADIFAFKLDQPHDESIRFIGYMQEAELPALYTAARVFAFPSFFEGFGLPVLEAMACGTAVITSNTTSLKELAADKALTVPPDDTEAIAKAIDALLKSDSCREEYVEKGKKHAQTFSWDEAARQTKKVLEECVI
jgi:glycosyltransferase involved in cell wall biosynthesis